MQEITTLFAAFAAIMSLVNFVALACIHYNLNNGLYPPSARS